MVDNEHANQGSQCTLVVHNVALYGIGSAQDDFACSLSIIFDGVQCSVVSLSAQIMDNVVDKVTNK